MRFALKFWLLSICVDLNIKKANTQESSNKNFFALAIGSKKR